MGAAKLTSLVAAGLAATLTWACGDSSSPSTPLTIDAVAGAGSTELGSGGDSPEDAGDARPQPLGVSDVFEPQPSVSGRGGGGYGRGQGHRNGLDLLAAPFGVSTTCGDAILGPNEECDDGAGGAGPDACTDGCQTRDQPGDPAAGSEEPSSDRYLGAGRHPVAGNYAGFIATYVDANGDTPEIGATLFDIWGRPTQHIIASEDASPIFAANPVAAGLPNGGFAVAWGDFDGDGSDLGIALRQVNVDGSLGPLHSANAGREFSQLNPDMIWTGTELIVAWEDYADAANGPDIRYQVFDENLHALSGTDLPLAETAAPEAAVALAPFNGGWAAAYREGLASGGENIVVRSGDAIFRIGPVQGGPLDDRPALVELDATHLLVTFSAGTDPSATGVYNVPRIRYAVIDTESEVAPQLVSLDPLDDLYSVDNKVSHSSPAAVKAADGAVYVTWRSEARSGDAAGDQIWIKRVSWDAARETELDLHEPEMLIPRACEGSIGDQRTPAVAPVPLPPDGALAMAWDDYSHSQGPTSGSPDVVVHYAPLHARSSETPRQVIEKWTGTNGADWPAQWSHWLSAYTVNPVTILWNEGQVAWTGAGTAVSYINNHTALDVDMVTKVRFNLNSNRAGFVARLVESNPPGNPEYIGARIGTLINDTWRIFAVINGQEVVIQDGPVLNLSSYAGLFTNWAQDLGFFLRFRIRTDVSNSNIFIGIKHWLQDVPEPEAWTIEKVVTSATILNKFGTTPGRFGLVASNNQAGRVVSFDDFRATYYEGSVHGDPTLTPAAAALKRSPPVDRACTPDSPCAVGEGCCTGDTDCVGDGTKTAECGSAQGEFLGYGSHATACVFDHCSDKARNTTYGETRADCGGPDCAPCSCQSTIAPGASGYCSTTCLCGSGEWPCSADNQCLPGLACKPNAWRYDLTAAAYNTCQPYHCFNRVIDSGVGETAPDCGGECGSCACSTSNGGPLHCRQSCPCLSGNGYCTYNDECAAGLICGSVKTGPRFGLVASSRACVVPHCDNGIFEPALGETAKDCGSTACGSCP